MHDRFLQLLTMTSLAVQSLAFYGNVLVPNYWNLPNQRYSEDLMDIRQNLVSTNVWPSASTPPIPLNSAAYSQPYQYHNIPLPIFPSFTRLENTAQKAATAIAVAPEPEPRQQHQDQQQFTSYRGFAAKDSRLQHLPMLSHIEPQDAVKSNDRNQILPENYIGSVVELKSLTAKPVDESDLTQISDNNSVILPPFLKDASPEDQKKFTEIITNPNEGFLQKQQKLDTLIEGMDEQTQEIYRQYQHSKDQEEQAKRERIHETVAVMSQDAQIIFAKVSAVLTNRELSDSERWQKLHKIYSAMPTKIRDEFNEKFGELL